MEFNGFLGIPKESNGIPLVFLRIPMEFNGFLWYSFGVPKECRRIPFGAPLDFVGIPKESYGIQWIP